MPFEYVAAPAQSLLCLALCAELDILIDEALKEAPLTLRDLIRKSVAALSVPVFAAPALLKQASLAVSARTWPVATVVLRSVVRQLPQAVP